MPRLRRGARTAPVGKTVLPAAPTVPRPARACGSRQRTRSRKLCSSRREIGRDPGSRNPPPSCACGDVRGSSSRASASPRASATIRSRTPSSKGATTAPANSFRHRSATRAIARRTSHALDLPSRSERHRDTTAKRRCHARQAARGSRLARRPISLQARTPIAAVRLAEPRCAQADASARMQPRRWVPRRRAIWRGPVVSSHARDGCVPATMREPAWRGVGVDADAPLLRPRENKRSGACSGQQLAAVSK